MFMDQSGCPHVADLRNIRLGPQFEPQRLKEGLQCYLCEKTGQNPWLCIHADCLRIMCSEDHSLIHYQRDTKHCLRVNVSSLRIWCYQCECEVLAPSGDPEDIDSTEPKPKGLTGLQNIGNTCYMNAALQALSNCPPLVHHFLSRPLPPTGPGSGGGGDTLRQTTMGPASPSLTRSFHRLMLDMWSPRKPPYIAPTAILYGIRNSHPMFRGFHQHDTQEFLRCLMDQLHEEMKVPVMDPPLSQAPRFLSLDTLEQISEGEGGAASSQSEGEEYETCDSGVSERSSLSDEGSNPQPASKPLRSISRSPSPPGDHRRLKNSSKAQSHLSQHSSPSRRKHINYRSIISDVFDGKLISSVQCLTCNRISTRVETFQDLSLPIPNRDHLNMLHQGSVNTSPTKCAHLYANDQGWWAWLWDLVCSWFWGPTVGLHDCLAAFFSSDELKGDNMYSCEKCNKLRNGVKYSRVLECPEVLCIHLKRFRHEVMFSSKISNYVTFPLEGLELRPYLHASCPSQVTTYDLISVICHHGTAGGGGHYTCYALNSQSQQWYEFDDQSVREVWPETVRNSEAYVLFYRKDCSSVNRWRRRAARLQEMTMKETDTGVQYLIGRDWLDRFNTFAEPGPIENRMLLCPHGALAPEADSVVVAQPIWQFLHSKFGGGPVCRMDKVTPCEQCSEQTGETSLLRVQLHEFLRLQSLNCGPMYAVSSSWLSDWESYVKGLATQPPGPIDNTILAQLTSNEEFCEVTGGQWEMLVKLYGGGPPIPLKESSDSDSRSLDEQMSTCENLDSGCWLHNTGTQPPQEQIVQDEGVSCELVEVQTVSTHDDVQQEMH